MFAWPCGGRNCWPHKRDTFCGSMCHCLNHQAPNLNNDYVRFSGILCSQALPTSWQQHDYFLSHQWTHQMKATVNAYLKILISLPKSKNRGRKLPKLIWSTTGHCAQMGERLETILERLQEGPVNGLSVCLWETVKFWRRYYHHLQLEVFLEGRFWWVSTSFIKDVLALRRESHLLNS